VQAVRSRMDDVETGKCPRGKVTEGLAGRFVLEERKSLDGR